MVWPYPAVTLYGPRMTDRLGCQQSGQKQNDCQVRGKSLQVPRNACELRSAQRRHRVRPDRFDAMHPVRLNAVLRQRRPAAPVDGSKATLLGRGEKSVKNPRRVDPASDDDAEFTDALRESGARAAHVQ